MVAATAMDRNAPTRFSDADSATAAFGLSAPVAIERGHRVAGVVETVGEIERKRGDHDDEQQKQFNGHGFDSLYPFGCMSHDSATNSVVRPSRCGPGWRKSIGQSA